MSRALLDVNVLLALLDSDHAHHVVAQDWLRDNLTDGWASCPITENGFVRILSQPRYPSPISPGEAMSLLTRACGTQHHQFWPCDLSALDQGVVDSSKIHGSKHVTDSYLLALAVRHAGVFVTFDRAIPTTAVRRATPEHLVIL
ncbi:MAG: TA system VapC family ribonuclease toxin [Ornithinimicrobium sp.]